MSRELASQKDLLSSATGGLAFQGLLKLLDHPTAPGHILAFIGHAHSYRRVISKARFMGAWPSSTRPFDVRLDLLIERQAFGMQLWWSQKSRQFLVENK